MNNSNRCLYNSIIVIIIIITLIEVPNAGFSKSIYNNMIIKLAKVIIMLCSNYLQLKQLKTL